MVDDFTDFDSRCLRVQEAVRHAAASGPLVDSLRTTAIALATETRAAGRTDLAILILEMLVARATEDLESWRLLGFCYGEDQRLPQARMAFAHAAKLVPNDPQIAFALAQASLDSGLPAEALFARAVSLAPDNLAAVEGRAAALVAQGDGGAAVEWLADSLQRHPGWLQGHKSLAALRWTSGESHDFAGSYRLAAAAEPGNLPLRLAWFSALAQARDWDAASSVVEQGEALWGETSSFAIARAYLAGESGRVDLAEDWFQRTASIQDDFLGIAHLRHCLRTDQLEKAERLAFELLAGRSAPVIWPYLSVIWRLRGDARARWLDGEPPYIRSYDDLLTSTELQELANVLRRLQIAKTSNLEQSVRGGTQTDADRQLFFRSEAQIQSARTAIRAAVTEYVAGMPASIVGHPLLGISREQFRFSGSWSVRLTGLGHHVSHTHPKGWISSAFYVSLPPLAQLGRAPAGWIRFGVPPSTLSVNLPAYAQIEPKPGRLVLFPSTMWHETLPFDDGERLVIAFDVIASRPPRPR